MTFLYLSCRDEFFLFFLLFIYFFVYFCNFRSVLNLNPYMSTGSINFLDLMAEVWFCNKIGVCKKPRNWKNRFKPTELVQKFRFGFGFIIWKTENFGSVFGCRFEWTEPNWNICRFGFSKSIWWYSSIGAQICELFYFPFSFELVGNLNFFCKWKWMFLLWIF